MHHIDKQEAMETTTTSDAAPTQHEQGETTGEATPVSNEKNPFTSGAVCMADLANDPLPTVDFLVERLGLSSGRASLIYGTAGVGKSVVVSHIATAIALNRKLFDRYEAAPAETLWLDFELGQRECELRLRQQIEGFGASLEDAPGLSFRSFPRLRLDDPAARDHLLKAADGRGLIVIDPLSRATSCSENDARGVSDAIAMSGEISTQTGCVVLWVHHAGKRASSGLRGSSTIMDAAQCVLRVTSPGPGRITLEQTKAVPIAVPPLFLQFEEVGGIAPETRRARGLRLVEYDPDEPIEDKPQKPDARHQIIAILEEHREGASGRLLRKMVGGNTQRYVQSLRVLVAQEIVIAKPDPSDGRRTIYQLTRYSDDFEEKEGRVIEFPRRSDSEEDDDV